MAKTRPYEVYADSRMVDHDKWLELRRSGIGGSDAGAIMGVNPYKGPFSVWADKMGYESAIEDSEAMRQGRDLEEYVARRFAERTGQSVAREYGMLRSKRYPCIVANIDRKIRGQRAGLECKTSRDIYMRRYRGGEIPMEYYCQCLHYMAVTGWRAWYLAVLVYGTELLVYKLCREGADLLDSERDKVVRIDVPEEDMEALIGAETAFWRDHVERMTPPPPDGLRSTGDALGIVYRESEDCSIDSTGEEDVLISRLIELKKRMKADGEEARLIENRIKGRMGAAEEMRSAEALITWRPQRQRRISEKRIREFYPMVDVDKIKETVDLRRFAVRAEEEEE